MWAWDFSCCKLFLLLIQSLLIGLFWFSISPWVILLVCAFLGICPFPLGSLICCYTTVQFPHNPSDFCEVDRNVPSFVPDFRNLNLLSYFFGQSSYRFINCVDLFKERTLFLLIFLYCFSIVSFIPTLSLPSFLSFLRVICFSFPRSSCAQLCYWLEILPLFHYKRHCHKFLFKHCLCCFS